MYFRRTGSRASRKECTVQIYWPVTNMLLYTIHKRKLSGLWSLSVKSIPNHDFLIIKTQANINYLQLTNQVVRMNRWVGLYSRNKVSVDLMSNTVPIQFPQFQCQT